MRSERLFSRVYKRKSAGCAVSVDTLEKKKAVYKQARKHAAETDRERSEEGGQEPHQVVGDGTEEAKAAPKGVIQQLYLQGDEQWFFVQY